MGISFIVHPSHIDEQVSEPLTPEQLVEFLALSKAREVAGQYPGTVVLGADTIVVVEGEVLGKPADRAEAIAMLERLAGREHLVMTGVALVRGERVLVSHEETTVRFGPLTRAQIERYVDSGEPMDKAGGYGIQGRGAALVHSVEGDYYNVVGLPLYRTIQMMSQFDLPVL